MFLGVVDSLLMTFTSIRFKQSYPYPRGSPDCNVLHSQVKIMLPWDPSGKIGPKKPLPDHVSIVEPKEETLPPNPFSETKAAKPDQAHA